MNSVLVVHVLVTKQNKEKKDPGRPSNTNTENPPKTKQQTVREITLHANDILTQKIGLFIHHLNKQEPKLNYRKTSVKLCHLHWLWLCLVLVTRIFKHI